jgi:lipoyl-dependent peroxiredoxin subunit D
VAAALAGKSSALLHVVVAEASHHVDAQVVNGAKAAATIMAMNNVYYRFQHLAGHEKYQTMPARLRMNVMRTHGVNALDFELWSVAVSAINGCGTCMESHDRKLRESGVSEETVLMAVRVAAVVNAISTVLESDLEPAAVAV